MTNMISVSRQQFDETMQRLNAIPDGFKLNGSYTQTNWYGIGNKLVGRSTKDSFGEVYEITGGFK